MRAICQRLSTTALRKHCTRIHDSEHGIAVAELETVQALLKSRSPVWTAPRIVSGPTLLTGICFCAACGMAMTLRTGKSGRYRYYTCSTKARQGETGCRGRTVPIEKLDT